MITFNIYDSQRKFISQQRSQSQRFETEKHIVSYLILLIVHL